VRPEANSGRPGAITNCLSRSPSARTSDAWSLRWFDVTTDTVYERDERFKSPGERRAGPGGPGRIARRVDCVVELKSGRVQPFFEDGSSGEYLPRARAGAAAPINGRRWPGFAGITPVGDLPCAARSVGPARSGSEQPASTFQGPLPIRVSGSQAKADRPLPVFCGLPFGLSADVADPVSHYRLACVGHARR
jgi:hypothetical protein